MIAIYILVMLATILNFSLWFVVREVWVQNIPTKNKWFWVVLILTFIFQVLLLFVTKLPEKPKPTAPTEKVKITISSNIPKDSIELVIRPINETHSTDLP